MILSFLAVISSFLVISRFLTVISCSLVFSRSDPVFPLSDLVFSRNDLVLSRSDYVYTGSDLEYSRSDLMYSRSESRVLLCFQACKHFFDGEKCVAHCPPPLIYDSEKFEYRRNPDVKYSYGTLCVDKCPCEYPHAYTQKITHTHTPIQYTHPILIHLKIDEP